MKKITSPRNRIPIGRSNISKIDPIQRANLREIFNLSAEGGRISENNLKILFEMVGYQPTEVIMYYNKY